MTGGKMGCRDPRGFRDLMLAVAGAAANNTIASVFAPNQCLEISTLPTNAARNAMPETQATSAQFTASRHNQSICTRYPNLLTAPTATTP